MSKKLYEESNIQDIANAIREKNGTQNQYTPAQMSNAVRNIHATPDLESLSVTTNGDYLPSSGKDGFSAVHVAVPTGGSDPILQEKTATQNGIVLPDSGYDGLSKVNVNVNTGSSLIANWDLTKSLIDSEHGLVSTLQYGAIQDTDGVHITVDGQYISFSRMLWANARTYEIDIGDMNLVGSQHHRFFMFDYDKGLIYRNNGKWSFYNGSWATDSDISSFDYFVNSTIKVVIDVEGYWHIYKNNVLVYEPSTPMPFNSCTILSVGSNSQSALNATVRGFRVM